MAEGATESTSAISSIGDGDAFRVAIELDVLLVASRALAMLQAKKKDQGNCLMNVFIL